MPFGPRRVLFVQGLRSWDFRRALSFKTGLIFRFETLKPLRFVSLEPGLEDHRPTEQGTPVVSLLGNSGRKGTP